jgi:hypothetical protein
MATNSKGVSVGAAIGLFGCGLAAGIGGLLLVRRKPKKREQPLSTTTTITRAKSSSPSSSEYKHVQVNREPLRLFTTSPRQSTKTDINWSASSHPIYHRHTLAHGKCFYNKY